MRRANIIILFVLCAAAVSAQTFDPFKPEHPVVMGRGGSFTADATGYNSFFYNPAGFARGGELTLASMNAWVFMDRDLVSIARGLAGDSLGFSSSVAPSGSRSIDQDAFESLSDNFADLEAWVADEDPAVMEQIIQNAAGDAGITFSEGDDLADVLAAAGTDDIIAFLEAVDDEADALATSPLYDPNAIDDLLLEVDSALPKGFLRVGAQAGIGYVGNGIGLGLFANADVTVDGTNILEAYGNAFNTISFVGGLGLNFGNLSLGVAVRPTVFGYGRVNAAPILASYLAGGDIDFSTMFTETVYFGSGLGVDLGAHWALGPLSVGVSARDFLGTQINYSKTDFDTYLQSLRQASLPIGEALTAEELESAWTIPMKINAGIQFNPALGVVSFLVDPKVSVDLLDMTSAIRLWQRGEQITAEEIVSMLNFGGEVNLLQFLSLRAGYYGGYLSAGIGFDIFLLDINAAVVGDFGRDDAGSWGFNNVGGSVEVGIRF